MANPFDQFDAQSVAVESNPFDRFDAPPSPYAGLLQTDYSANALQSAGQQMGVTQAELGSIGSAALPRPGDSTKYRPSMLGTTALRVGAPLLAGVSTGGLGLVPALAVTGGVSALGEAGAEGLEAAGGERNSLSLPQITTAGVLGSVPGIPLGRIASPLARAGIRVAEGGALGGAAPVIQSGLEGELPRIEDVKEGIKYGAMFGVPFGGIEALAARNAARSRAVLQRIEGKPLEQQKAIVEQEIKLGADTDSPELKRAGLELKQQIDTALEQQKAQETAVSEQQKAVADQQKAVADAQQAQADAVAAAQEVPKSTQILQESKEPPSLANVATEAGTQTSPFALQGKLNEITAIPTPSVDGQLAQPKPLSEIGATGAAPEMAIPREIKATTPAQIAKLGAEDFAAWAKQQPEGLTPEAHRAGITAIGDAEAIAKLKSSMTASEAEYKAALKRFKEGDETAMDEAGSLAAKRQYFREAVEAAENTGSAATVPEVMAAHAEAAPVIEAPAPKEYSLKAPKPLLESIGSIDEVLAYRKERIENYRKVVKAEIGLSDEKTDRLIDLLRNDRDTARFERGLPPEQRAKLEAFFDGPLNQRNGPLEDWIQGSKDLSEIAKSKDPRMLAKEIVDSVGNIGREPEFHAGDDFALPVVALQRLKEVGGTWRDVSEAVKAKLANIRAGNDATELYDAYGRNVKNFADKYGLELPLEPNAQVATGETAPRITDSAPPLNSVSESKLTALADQLGIKTMGMSGDRLRARIESNAHPDDIAAAIANPSPARIPKSRRGSIPISVMSSAGGAVAGGTAGYLSADPQAPGESDEAYKARVLSRTLAGAGIGGVGGLAIGGALSRGARTRAAVAPESGPAPRSQTIKAPEVGENQGVRRLAEKVIDDKSRTERLRRELAENPEIVYDKFLANELRERVEAATPEELAAMRVSGDRNQEAAALIELSNRAAEAGQDAEAAALYAQASTKFTSGAQLLNVAKNVRSPLGYVEAVKDDLKAIDRTLTPEQEKQVRDIAKESIKADRELITAERNAEKDFTPENQSAYKAAQKKAGEAKRQLAEYINKITPEGLDDLTIKIIQGNMLTPLSQGANVWGNIMFQPVRRGAMSIASGLDAIYSGITKLPRTIDRTNPLPGDGEIEAFADGIKVASKELLTGPGADSYVKNEVQRGFRPIRSFIQGVTGKDLPLNAAGKVSIGDRAKKFIEGTAGAAPEVMFRLLNLGDKGFRRAAEAETLLEQARLRGLKGRDLEKFIEFPDKATQELLDTEARKAIFAQDNAGVRQLNQFLDSGLAKLLHLDQIPVAKGAIKVFGRLNIPFRQFPINYVMSALNFAAPELALAKGMYYSAKGDRRKALTNIGEGIMGQLMYGAAAFLWSNGLISEPTDKDAKQRSIQYDNMGGQRVNLSGLARKLGGGDPTWRRDDITADWGRTGIPAPVFYVYTKNQVQDRKQLQKTGVSPKQDSSVLGMLSDRVADYPGIGQFALDQSFLAGSSAFLEALKNGFTGPEADAWAANMFKAASTLAVPNTVEGLARAQMEYIPELRGDTLGETVKNIWDFKTFQLPKDDRLLLKRDIWGEPIKRTPDNQNPYVYQFLDVTKAASQKPDEFKRNLLKTFNESDNPGAYPAIPDRTMTLEGVTAKLEPKDYETLQALTGRLRRQEVEPMVIDPDFMAVPAGERVAELERAYSRAASEAKQALLSDEAFQMKYFPELYGVTPSSRVTGRNTAARNRLEQAAPTAPAATNPFDQFDQTTAR